MIEALRCEDYEEEGLLELSQLQEAISTVNEDLEPSVLDYMLYYVLVRSGSAEQMQYKNLITMLDSLIEGQGRAQSASRKNRPESSSPEKLKMRNPGMAGKAASGPSQQKDDDDEDHYSDEEIANDPDEDDDDTHKLRNLKNPDELDDDDDDEEYLKEFERVKQEKAKANNQYLNQDGDEDDDEYANDEDDQEFEDSPR